jgi:pyruvate,orthophosphate dikinase
MAKWVYSFGGGKSEGKSEMRNLLGGKGANLAEMSNLGLPVPPGFTITTEVCTHFYANKRSYPAELKAQTAAALGAVEKIVGRKFGDAKKPLLVSVRSGARASMPGMMDTVLNLGLNDATVEGLARESGDARFAFDSYRRFIQMYGGVVLDIAHHHFEELLERAKSARGYALDTEMTAGDWKELVAEYKTMVEKELGRPFPQDPHEQLWGAIGAVFVSWMNDRAITYRRLYQIPEEWGTAVNVQAMVFGNMGGDCATGVAFTRDPSTGENAFYGEFLINAQGEDVVAGIRTPQQLTKAGREKQGAKLPSMEEAMPETYAQLVAIRARLERHYRDIQDIEFTVEKGVLYMLQTRSGKRTAAAALRIAVEMAEEGLIDRKTAVSRIDPASLDQLLHPTLDPKAPRTLLSRALPASPGAASGIVCFSADEAETLAAAGKSVILVRIETSPEDIHGMHAARGILTTRGGMTSHAAVVARGMGRACVAGAGEIRVDYAAKTMSIRGRTIAAGESVTIDGGTGEVFAGEVPTVQPELSGHFARIMEWADSYRRMKVRTNAETPLDARTARRFGAEGIGLCRTEHMFFEPSRILAVREMIVADDAPARAAALAKIMPFQRADFVELFEIMAGLPVTIRLLDPPLHEFLPHSEADFAELARTTGKSVAEVKARAEKLTETNPMLGHRGCRLAVTYPEIYQMQVRAIFEAAILVAKAKGETVAPEIMIPLVAVRRELDVMRDHIAKVADEVRAATGEAVEYSLGTMIELPRAALRAAEIAETAEFFSFGTNDLTQTTFGLSRDDAANFLGAYEQQKILVRDPFVTLDQEGVGELVKMACARGRTTRPDIKLGICGEHGGDPASIQFCETAGLDYVSCSPYRVPIARLAAAQAALQASASAASLVKKPAAKKAAPALDRHARVRLDAARRGGVRQAPARAASLGRLAVAKKPIAKKPAAKKPAPKKPAPKKAPVKKKPTPKAKPKTKGKSKRK